MCRVVAYFGPPIRISAVLTEPTHGLVRQSYAPREMTCGTLNADGWGVGWFTPDSGSRPGVLKGILPVWSDENAVFATQAITSNSFVAAVRSASPGMGIAWANTPPYAWEDRLFVHNGRLWPWPGSVAKVLRNRLEPEDESTVRGTTDSELLGAVCCSQIRRKPGLNSLEAIRGALRDVLDVTEGFGGGIAANLVLAEVSGFLAVRFARPGPAPSLYLLEHEARWSYGTLVASEPLDDSAGWREVSPSTVVWVDERGTRIEPLFR